MKSSFRLIDVECLELDIENPRIAHNLEQYVSVEDKQKAIRPLLLSDYVDADDGKSIGSSNLKESIKANGGIIHPIIVSHDSQKNKYKVVEGNTRVQIYREFKRTNTSGNWDKIPAMIYTDLPKVEIDAIRLQAHLVGPREWKPYAKAKYLSFLYNERNMTLNQIVDFCGGNKNEVMKYISAYRIMEDEYKPLLSSSDTFEPTVYSAFAEVQNPQIRDALARHNFTLRDFSLWVIDGKFPTHSTVRQLHRVLDNAEAKKIFLAKGKDMKDASEVVYLSLKPAVTALADASREQLARVLIKSLRKILLVEQRAMAQDPLNDERISLMELFDELAVLREELEK